MNTMHRLAWSIAATLLAPALSGQDPAGQDPTSKRVDFARQVRPLLSQRCFSCHGRDAKHRKAKLRLDSRDGALANRKAGAAVVPGHPDRSLLVQKITAGDPEDRMPPAKSGPGLSAAEVDLLRRWIEQGAEYAPHWAFQAPERPAVPKVADTYWPRNPIDHFVLRRLESERLQPTPEAERFTLLRRLSFDLTGLPPTPRETVEFIFDRSPGAYEKLVDRLLESPAFGERWARVWLDLARYADTQGYEKDNQRTIWPWRDWVIEALNADMPFDRFTVEQLAGDLRPDPTPDQVLATAFHRNTMTNTEGGTDDEEFRVAAVKDRVDTTGLIWLGLSVGCAKCHEHKYDPITQGEYYRMYAFFDQSADADRYDDAPRQALTSGFHRDQQKGLLAELAAARVELERSPGDGKALQAVTALQQSLAGYASRMRPVAVPVMRDLPADKARTTRVLRKGNFLDPGEPVEPGVPAFLHPLAEAPVEGRRTRLHLARWLMDPANPLTARVTVNRIWARMFGVGLVATEEDFGTQGELPSHPDLLDWLAVEFRDTHRWSLKKLCKTIVMSATYRQGSGVTAELLARDPDNRLLARGPRFRLEAEMIRDQALAAAGLLSRKLYGPPVMPPQPDGIWKSVYNSGRWVTSTGEDRYRRGIYTFAKRTAAYPSSMLFDAGSGEYCLPRRIRTNTVTAALVTLNDPVYTEAAQALARRIVRDGGNTPMAKATFGWQLTTGRPPSEAESRRLVQLLEAQLEHYGRDRDAAVQAATVPLGALPEGMDPLRLAAWTVVAAVLLNLDETLTKG